LHGDAIRRPTKTVFATALCVEEASVVFEPGDTILFFTNEMTEVRALDRELFGTERRRCTAVGIENLRAAVREYEQTQAPGD
jgi:serine phosphatase RsbU (regulator of sigma subunit)